MYLDIQQESSGSGLVLHAPNKELLFSVKLKKKEACFFSFLPRLFLYRCMEPIHVLWKIADSVFV
mgnify:CR=1 FL=1